MLRSDLLFFEIDRLFSLLKRDLCVSYAVFVKNLQTFFAFNFQQRVGTGMESNLSSEDKKLSERKYLDDIKNFWRPAFSLVELEPYVQKSWPFHCFSVLKKFPEQQLGLFESTWNSEMFSVQRLLLRDFCFCQANSFWFVVPDSKTIIKDNVQGAIGASAPIFYCF